MNKMILKEAMTANIAIIAVISTENFYMMKNITHPIISNEYSFNTVYVFIRFISNLVKGGIGINMSTISYDKKLVNTARFYFLKKIYDIRIKNRFSSDVFVWFPYNISQLENYKRFSKF